MHSTSATRKPFAEVQNLQTNNDKTQIDRSKSMIAKPASKRESKLPVPRHQRGLKQDTAGRRTQIVAEQGPPVPSRMGAKPKRTASTAVARTRTTMTVHDRDGSQPKEATNRRVTSSMSFTPMTASSRGGLTGSSRPHVNEPMLGGEKIDTIVEQQSIIMERMEQLTINQNPTPTEMKDADLVAMVKELSQRVAAAESYRNDNSTQLSEEIVKANQSILEATRKHHETEQTLQREQHEGQNLRREIEDLKLKIESLQKAEAEFLHQSQASTKHIEHLETRLKEAENSRSKIHDEKESLQQEMEEKKRDVMAVEAELDKTRGRMEELQRKIDDANREFEAKSSEVARLMVENQTLQSEKDKLGETVSEEKENLSRETKRAASFQCEVESMRKELAEAQKESQSVIISVKGDLEDKVKDLESNRAELEQSNTAHQQNITSLKEEISQLTQALASQERAMSALHVETKGQQIRLESMQSTVTENTLLIQKLEAENEEKLEIVAALETQAREDAAVRRRLHNEVQELKGNIRVYCRVRPLLGHELESPTSGSAKALFEYTEKGQGIVAKQPTRSEKTINGVGKSQTYPFKFDKVFGPNVGQEPVFDEISQLVQSALDGYRVCIFAYGQTGSGKTHTMLGTRDGNGSNLGMVPRSVRQIFESAKKMEEDHWEFRLRASFLEIYNDCVRDLLNDSSAVSKKKGKEENHKIIFDLETKMSTVVDLTVEEVENEEQVQRLINRSMKNRATAATKANDRSSRSHSVFRLHIEGKNNATGEELDGLLNLIDLAGSERLTQSKAEGDRLRETKHINKSLSALGDVIAALANNDSHVPFRNSKLTYLLQDSLGGDCKTLMFVNVSHALESFGESLCSLRFAAKVNSCHVGTARRNAKIEL